MLEPTLVAQALTKGFTSLTANKVEWQTIVALSAYQSIVIEDFTDHRKVTKAVQDTVYGCSTKPPLLCYLQLGQMICESKYVYTDSDGNRKFSANANLNDEERRKNYQFTSFEDLAEKAKNFALGSKRHIFKVRIDSIRHVCELPDVIKAVTQVLCRKRDQAFKTKIEESTENALCAIRRELDHLANKATDSNSAHLSEPQPERLSQNPQLQTAASSGATFTNNQSPPVLRDSNGNPSDIELVTTNLSANPNQVTGNTAVGIGAQGENIYFMYLLERANHYTVNKTGMSSGAREVTTMLKVGSRYYTAELACGTKLVFFVLNDDLLTLNHKKNLEMLRTIELLHRIIAHYFHPYRYDIAGREIPPEEGSLLMLDETDNAVTTQVARASFPIPNRRANVLPLEEALNSMIQHLENMKIKSREDTWSPVDLDWMETLQELANKVPDVNISSLKIQIERANAQHVRASRTNFSNRVVVVNYNNEDETYLLPSGPHGDVLHQLLLKSRSRQPYLPTVDLSSLQRQELTAQQRLRYVPQRHKKGAHLGELVSRVGPGGERTDDFIDSTLFTLVNSSRADIELLKSAFTRTTLKNGSSDGIITAIPQTIYGHDQLFDKDNVFGGSKASYTTESLESLISTMCRLCLHSSNEDEANVLKRAVEYCYDHGHGGESAEHAGGTGTAGKLLGYY